MLVFTLFFCSKTGCFIQFWNLQFTSILINDSLNFEIQYLKYVSINRDYHPSIIDSDLFKIQLFTFSLIYCFHNLLSSQFTVRLSLYTLYTLFISLYTLNIVMSNYLTFPIPVFLLLKLLSMIFFLQSERAYRYTRGIALHASGVFYKLIHALHCSSTFN